MIAEQKKKKKQNFQWQTYFHHSTYHRILRIVKVSEKGSSNKNNPPSTTRTLFQYHHHISGTLFKLYSTKKLSKKAQNICYKITLFGHPCAIAFGRNAFLRQTSFALVHVAQPF